MSGSRLVESTDPDEFFALARPNCCRITITQRGAFKARTRLIEVGRLYAQRRREWLTRFLHVHNSRPGILFITEPGAPMFCNGTEIGYQDVLLFDRDATYVSRSSGPVEWGAITLDGDELEDAVSASFQAAKVPRRNGFRVIRPPAAALARLRSLHACLGRLATTAEEQFGPMVAQLGLAEMLIMAMLDNIAAAEFRSDTVARQHHHMMINRFFEILDASPTEPYGMQDITRKIGVPSRTFRMACQEQLGISPTQYLLLRRMNLARRALRQADPALIRVTDVATELGFWELGRFAVKYHEIFGETPSTTLRCLESARPRMGSPDYAIA